MRRARIWPRWSVGKPRAMGYLTDWTSGTVRMYTESATRYRTVTLKPVTGRSASITTCELAGVTSMNHGDAASCRRNVVYAWMSTVRPEIATRTIGAPRESAAAPGAGWPGCGGGSGVVAPAPAPRAWACVIQV